MTVQLQPEVQRFLAAIDNWGCDSYAVDVRYLAGLDAEGGALWEAQVGLAPLPPSADLQLQIREGAFSAGQHQRYPVNRAGLLKLLASATEGVIEVHGQTFTLPLERALDFASDITQRDRWFSVLHLQVRGARRPIVSALALEAIDTALRRGAVPFDGLKDLAAWFGIPEPAASGSPSTIDIRVLPPVDLIAERCELTHDQLRLVLHAVPKFDTTRIGLAVRAVPQGGLGARRQVSSAVKWTRPKKGRKEGTATIDVAGADSVLVMLTIGDTTVRRQWFLDRSRASNGRFVAVQAFDKDLRMIRQALLSSDADRFEKGVASLAFLLGFSSVIQVETDSPDLVVTTPGGRLVVVECTTRIADFAAKVGKLVDRRGLLLEALSQSGHVSSVLPVLVCGMPRERIAAQSSVVDDHGIRLLVREDLEAALDRVRFPIDPDQIVRDAEISVEEKRSSRFTWTAGK
jgi:hypothetical protein